MEGLRNREPGELAIGVSNGARYQSYVEEWLPFVPDAGAARERVEVEILFWPGEETFSGGAEFNVLVLMDAVSSAPLERAHLVVTDRPEVRFDPELCFPLTQFQGVWEALR